MTYTVVAWDRDECQLGLGTVSHSAGVLGKVLSRATEREEAVLVASQAFSSPALGRAVADLAVSGAESDVLGDVCLRSEGGRYRQVLTVSTRGSLSAFTGPGCLKYAGQVVDHELGVAVAGNMLRAESVIAAGYDAFRATPGPLEDRILAALDAAGDAGGDFRGDRAAGLVIASASDILMDVRVDDHDAPHQELRRLHVLAVRRSALVACYEWVIGGCLPDVALSVVDRLLPNAADPDVGAWLWVIARYAGLSAPQVGEEARLQGEGLLDRLGEHAGKGLVRL